MNATDARGISLSEPRHDGIRDDDKRDEASCLPPATPGDGDLEEAIDELLTQVRDATSFSTSLQFDEWEPLADDDKIRHVLAIVREAVRRGVEHGGGTHIVVSLARHDRQCRISISDDGGNAGVGGDDVETGRRTMDESARLLDGSIEVSRRKTGGTVVRLTFPS